jgi:hypothetical protein
MKRQRQLARGRTMMMMAVCAGSLGCAVPLAHPVASLSEARPDERVIVGDVWLEGRLSDWTPGIVLQAWLVITDDLVGASTSEGSGGDVKETGGLLHAAIPRGRTVYLSGIFVRTTIVVASGATFIPIHYKIAASDLPCQYVGTFGLRKQGDRIDVTLFDTFDRDRAILAREVRGCDLARGLATEPTEQDVRDARARRQEQQEREQQSRLAPSRNR